MSKKLILAVSLALLASEPMEAQNFSKAELVMGYSGGLIDPGVSSPGRDAARGWGASLTRNFTDWLSVTADFSGEYGHAHDNLDGSGPEKDFNRHYFLFGPRLNWSRERVSFYGRALFGAARTHASSFTDPSVGTTLPSRSSTNFAMGYGGGLDIRIHQRVAIRVIQIDYIPVRVNEPGEKWRHSVRFQAGVALRFGQ